MSGSRRPTPAEQHLGDRLSALVDGELGHESRERVLAHLATCAKCKAEADAQRRLKNVFAEAAPPPPSESFLARLQGLPAGGDLDGGGSPLGGGGLGRGLPGGSGAPRGGRPTRLPGGSRPFGVSADPFGYASSGAHATALTPSEDRALPGDPGDRGFRIHHVGRTDERPASRGLRFAFVAAGAVSLAAIALGGVSGAGPADTAAEARGGPGAGSNVTPAQTPGTGVAVSESRRRRSGGPASARSGRTLDDPPATVSTEAGAPLLPGGPPARGIVGAGTEDVVHTLTAPVLAGAVAVSPLIRPLTAAAPISLSSWPTAPGGTVPGLLTMAQPVPPPFATP